MGIDPYGSCLRCGAQLTIVDKIPALCDSCIAATEDQGEALIASYIDGRNHAEREAAIGRGEIEPEPPAKTKVTRAKKSG